MVLNRDQIQKELALLIDDMPVELHLHSEKTSKLLSFLKSVLTIITKDEQKIKELQAHNENLQNDNKYLRERLAEEVELKEDMRTEGEWLEQYEGSRLLKCSVCGYEYCDLIECTDYCGNCGAKMKGK